MGILSAGNSGVERSTEARSAPQTSLFGLGGSASTQFMDNVYTQNFNGKEMSMSLVDERADQFKRITGSDLDSVVRDSMQKSPPTQAERDEFSELGIGAESDRGIIISRLKKQDPERYSSISNEADVIADAKFFAKTTSDKASLAQANASGVVHWTGAITGGIASVVTNPLDLATIPLGAGVGTSLLKTIFIEAAINAGAELVSLPAVSSWQKEIGNDFGFDEGATRVMMGALFGGVLGGAGKLATKVGRESAGLGLSKGTRRASTVFQRLADSGILPAKAERAALQMSRHAEYIDQSPWLGNRSAERGRHAEMTQRVSDAFEEGKTSLDVDPVMSNKEFNEIDTTPNKADSERLSQQKEEIKKFQDKSKTESSPSTEAYSLDTLPQQILEKAENVDRLGAKTSKYDFTAEETDMIGEAGLKITDMDKMVDELQKRGKAGDRALLKKGDNTHVESYRKKLAQRRINSLDTTIKTTSKTIMDEERILAHSDSVDEAIVSGVDRKFEELSKGNEDLTIIVDGQEVSIATINKSFEAEESQLSAMTSCAT